MPEQREEAPLSPAELALAVLALAAAALLLWRDLFLLHPAYSSIDESFSVAYVQLGLEGRPLPFSLFCGSLCRWLQWLGARSFGPGLFSLHLPIFLSLLGEGALLWRLALRLAGARAALGALLYNFVCAFSLVRARSLLSFALAPCELLLVLNLLQPPSRGLACFFAGLAGGLLAFDYEAWMAGVAVLGVLGLASLQGPGKKKALFSGLALGLAVTLWISRADLASWILVRKSYSGGSLPGLAAGLAAGLRCFFGGGDSVAYLGPDQHPAAPFWGLPFLALGLWQARRRAWVWAWLALGLAPLAATAYASEPNRAIMAWPLLALLAGWGWSRLWSALEGKISRALTLLLFAALLGAGWADEAAAFAASMSKNYAAYYGRSEARLALGATLRERAKTSGGVTLLSDLSLSGGAELRFDAGPLPPGATILAWIPDDCLPAFGPRSGVWTFCQPFSTSAPERLLQPSAAWSARLQAANAQLQNFGRQLAPYGARENQRLIFSWLDAHPQADPWLRAALWARAMHDAALSGAISEDRVQALLKENLISAAPLYEPGILMLRTRPADAWLLLQKAKAVDPRRGLDPDTEARIRALASSAQKIP
jgi:hypothetical protein